MAVPLAGVTWLIAELAYNVAMHTALSSIKAAAAAFVTGNILTPLLWLALLVCPLCLVLCACTSGDIRWAFFGLSAFIIFFVIIIFLVGFLRSPDIMSSENHQQRMKAIGLIAGNSGYHPSQLIDVIRDTGQISNPKARKRTSEND